MHEKLSLHIFVGVMCVNCVSRGAVRAYAPDALTALTPFLCAVIHNLFEALQISHIDIS